MTLRVGWFTTGRGSGSKGMLDHVIKAIDLNELDAKIVFVFSNREKGESEITDVLFDEITKKNIPLITLSSNKFRKKINGKLSNSVHILEQWRKDFDTEISKLINRYQYDLIVLGGYMLVLTEQFCNDYYLLNLHPALPKGPIGTWQEVIIKLIRNNLNESGMMMHRAIKEVDKGPVATICKYSIKNSLNQNLWEQFNNNSDCIEDKEIQNSELFNNIRGLGLALESNFIIQTLNEFALKNINLTNLKISATSKLPIDLSNLSIKNEK
ncbi:MAG: Folate-dependent phosphoribosylglycinamide formyltransferase PurN [Chloroflexi bacterium]|jgi:phosphoribosylglycinamide formyltransferase-1|nr:MAG: Folate-dependent phosphoribosylglycinamide formyltransferase PurN [Chloroflexota bacterium]|tara:strand:+ start:2561 stop:3364 length:804 start_codon:yes stop_codon:yes gene_type:complete